MKTIKFLDQGQDFLEWIVNNGVIIDCQPFQFKFWVGKKVIIKNNDILFYCRGKNHFHSLAQTVSEIKNTDEYYQRGYNDGISNQKNSADYSSNDQYKFGFNVALYNKNLESHYA